MTLVAHLPAGAVPAPAATSTELLARGDGKVLSKHLVDLGAVRSTFAGGGILAGTEVAVFGTTTCTGVRRRFTGRLDVAFADPAGTTAVRWRGAHVGREVDASGSLFVQAAGTFEVTGNPVLPSLQSLDGQFALAEIRVDAAGLFTTTLLRLLGGE